MQTDTHIAVAVKSLLLYKGRALLLRRCLSERYAPGCWETPGGMLEFGESPQQCALREIIEETGIDANLQQILYADTAFIKPHQQLIIIYYLAQANSDAVSLSEEHTDYYWATHSEVLEMLEGEILKSFMLHDVLPKANLLP